MLRGIKKIGIIGNTLAALNAANQLSRVYNVTLFKDSTEFAPPTTGTVLPIALAKQHQFPYLDCRKRIMLQRCDALPGNESVVFSQDYRAAFCNMFNLYEILDAQNRSYVTLHTGIKAINPQRDTCHIQTTDGCDMEFDLIISATQLSSDLHSQFFPHVSYEKRPVTTWSGTVGISKEDTPKFSNHLLYYMLNSGYLMLYLFPEKNHDQTGQSIIHWRYHEKQVEPHKTNITPLNTAPEKQLKHLKSVFYDLPIRVTNLLIESKNLVEQHPNIRFLAPNLYHQNVALIGASAQITTSHTTSFAQRELMSSNQLCQTLLKSIPTSKEDLNCWSNSTVEINQCREHNEEKFIDDMITHPVYWSGMSKQSIRTWFANIQKESSTPTTPPPITPSYHHSLSAMQHSMSQLSIREDSNNHQDTKTSVKLK